MTKTERKSLQEKLDREVSHMQYMKKAKNSGYICPLCGSGTHRKMTGALMYYPRTNTSYCHACGKFASVYDLIMYKYGCSFTEAFESLATEHGYDMGSNNFFIFSTPTPISRQTVQEKETEEEPEQEYDFSEYYISCRKNLADPRCKEYLASRGITLETAYSYYIGFDPIADPRNCPGGVPIPGKNIWRNARIIAPCTKDHYETRSIKELGNARAFKSRGHVRLFNIKALKSEGPVFVVEAFFDCLSIEQLGYHAVAINGSNNWRTLLNRPELSQYHGTFILCPDFDSDPGTKATVVNHFSDLATGLQEKGFTVKIDYLSNPYKDINEMLCKDKESLVARLQEQVKG